MHTVEGNFARRSSASDALPAGKLLLLVEDEAPLRELLSAALERHGYRVEALRHGGEVDDWHARGEAVPDLLLVDLHLPGEDGRSVAQRLKQLWPTLPVILMSGLPDEGVGEADELLLVKPFRLGELTERVAGALRRGSRG